jgi:hypothetical protein
MDELNRNKFWIAIGRYCDFTGEDNHIFRVWPKESSKSISIDLMPKFVVDQDLESARRQAHFFIDKMFNDYVKVDKERGIEVPPNQSLNIASLDTLTIEQEPSKPKNNNDLLDLEGLLK